MMVHAIMLGLMALLAAGGGVARAATIGAGAFSVALSPGIQIHVAFDDASFDVFGVPMNLGQSVGTVSGTASVLPGGTFTESLATGDPAVFAIDYGGAYIAASNGIAFVGTVGSLTGTAVAPLASGLEYTVDGFVRSCGSPDDPPACSPPGTAFGGRVAINAFQPAETPASPGGCSGAACAVTATPPDTTAVNAATGAVVPLSGWVTLPFVTTAGTTTITALSNVAGALVGNFAFNDDVTYVDVSTTALYDTSEAPIEVCLGYAIAGMVGDPARLRLMHLEAGVWTDVTSRIEPVAQVICGLTSSLSPFAVAVSTACTADGDCDDLNPCTVDTCAAPTCSHAPAGQGTLCRAATGQCDVPEVCDGTSAVCPSDAHVGDGSPCDDGDVCTSGETCQGGLCPAGAPLICGPCTTCQSEGCVAAPRTGCKRSTKAGAAKLQLSDRAGSDHDKITWKWAAGQATAFADFGSPQSGEDYALCIFTTSPAPEVALRARIPGAGNCGNKPCWKITSPKGVRYADPDATPEGISAMTLTAGTAGKAKVSLKGKGSTLQVPALPLALPLQVQLHGPNGICWEADYATALRNDGGALKASGQ